MAKKKKIDEKLQELWKEEAELDLEDARFYRKMLKKALRLDRKRKQNYIV